MAETARDLNESTHELSAAAMAVEQSRDSLIAAQAALAQTRDELAAAHRRDVAMAAKLKKAKADLVRAKAAVVAGQKKLDAERQMAGNMVRDQYQQQTNLLPIAILAESNSTADLQTRLQWSTTMFDTTKAQIDRLTVLQRQLKEKRERQAALERQIAADRKQAAENLRQKQALEAQAEQQEAAIASLLLQNTAAQAAAAEEVSADKQRYANLNAERAAVERRIAERIARARAEAARRAAADRAARIAAERAAARAEARAEARRAAAARAEAARAEAARAEARREAAQRERRQSTRSARSSKPSISRAAAPSRRMVVQKQRQRKKARASTSRSIRVDTGGSAGHGFDYPVSAGITSPYGMRFHPVLHYWKLHDGTDFGAGCGSPIRAPYSGRVSERYFNAGYGNRLMIDHGVVDGRYVTTGYNHAINYTVGVGERVSRGEVIGYVGTTGYSTGCHLHLMVWIDGGMRNPMTWF
ncbi:MAG TPA: M23 family metallopeptidase [Dermatophilaceae bacterium]|nr:M23 family metallopeptidase [Dermatophilaceae bacterium]